MNRDIKDINEEIIYNVKDFIKEHWMSKFLLLMIFLFGLIFSQDNINKIKSNNNPSSKEYIKLLEKSLKLLKTNYVDSINESEVIISGIKGLMKELDPYTKLLMSDSKALII